MVYNTANFIGFPMSGHRMRAINKKLISGRGTTLLLNKGGPGSASSFESIDEYISTTGINPYEKAKERSTQLSGQGFKGITDKLSKLSLGTKPKLKNIKLSI